MPLKVRELSPSEALFIHAWQACAPKEDQDVFQFWREYPFHPARDWRFDFAWVEAQVAVEIDGGTWSGGRHTRGTGYAKDAEKLNEALVWGWRVLRFTTDQLNNEPCACVQQVLGLLRGEIPTGATLARLQKKKGDGDWVISVADFSDAVWQNVGFCGNAKQLKRMYPTATMPKYVVPAWALPAIFKMDKEDFIVSGRDIETKYFTITGDL